MKIALVTMQLGPAYHTGTERYVESLGEGLRGLGHTVVLLGGDPDRRVSMAFGTGRDGGLREHPTRGWMTVDGPVEEARTWLQSERPDLVHLANPAHIGIAVGLAAMDLGIPVVVTAMDFWWTCPRATLLRDGERRCDDTPGWRTCVACVSKDHPRRTLRPLARLPDSLADLALGIYATTSISRGSPFKEVSRWKHRREHLARFLDRVDQVVFPSPATRDALAPRLEHTRWDLVPYGLAPAWFEAPRTARTSHVERTPPAALTLGYAGSLLPHKAPHLLLRAVRRLGWRDTHVRIAGRLDGSLAYGQQLVREAEGLHVEFTGVLDETEMRAFLRSLDVLAVTSLWDENLPFVMLEGLAAGIAVVASDVGGIAHCIPDKEMRFAAGDEAGLARALVAATEQPVKAAAVPTLAAMTEETLSIYDRARERCSGRSSGSSSGSWSGSWSGR